MERICLSKVNLLSNRTPGILKDSQEFEEVAYYLLKDQDEEEIQS